ncbi:hypothetical protein [Arthrobacter sp. NA-172]
MGFEAASAFNADSMVCFNVTVAALAALAEAEAEAEAGAAAG